MPRTFHILTESEPFTRWYNGVLARWVGNVVFEDPTAIVVAPAADDTWKFSPERIRVAPGLARYKTFYEGGGYHLPWAVNTALLRRILTAALHDLQAGDTVWIHNRPEFGMALASFIRSRGARLFLHLHNSHLVQWSERVTCSFKADCYIFNSRFLEHEALAKFPELGRTEVLPSGPDGKAFYPPSAPREAQNPDRQPVIVFSARMAPEKDILTFVKAMEILQQKDAPVRGVVIGGSNFGGRKPTTYLEELRSAAPPNVSFEPFTTTEVLGRLLRVADVFCMPPCWHEPISLHILEALACALPVVALESGGMPEELAKSGGIALSPYSAADLAETLHLLVTDSTTRTQMSQAGYKAYTRHFMWTTVRAGYRRVLALEPDARLQRTTSTELATA
jgi:spore coat protein SA